MLNILSKTSRGTLIEIEQEHGRKGSTYIVFAGGQPIDAAKTLTKAIRKANAFVGEKLFKQDGPHAHA